jgi:CheY-like chemotaxis protein
MELMNYNFILIDDVPMNNLVTRMVIKSVYSTAQILEFTDSQKGMDYIASQTATASQTADTIIFLDIYMPVIDGWAFMEQYDKLNDALKNKFKLYILSSSISKDDLKKAESNKNITGYVIKPFTKDTIRSLVANCIAMS